MTAFRIRRPTAPALAMAAVILATLAWFAFGRLAFAPVPWPDASAFYLPSIELLRWPPAWRMHAQAAFVSSYDEANFNLMPALPLVLGAFAQVVPRAWMPLSQLLKAVSLLPLAGFAWLLWSWSRELLHGNAHFSRRRSIALSAAIALAALWDPVVRWGTLVVRTETWVGLAWLWVLRELYRWNRSQALHNDEALAELWPRHAWRISAGLAFAAYFHFEAAYFVLPTVVGLGLRRGGWGRQLGVAWRTAALLAPWLLYVALHPALFLEQMGIQFFRLAHANYWVSNPYLFFHSLFLEHGSPAGPPKFFNLAKGIFWLLLLLVAVSAARKRLLSASRMPRAWFAAGVAFFACLYLWVTKAEVWFITMAHLTLWAWVALTVGSPASSGVRRRWIGGLTAAFAALSLAATFVQSRQISPTYSWKTYAEWIDCLERAAPRAATLRLWQPHVPDVLVELSERQPGWSLTRALDFPARRAIAETAGLAMDAVLLSRFTNPHDALADPPYEGPERPEDRLKLEPESEMPFGPWFREQLRDRRKTVCEVGPFWGILAVKKTP